MIATVTAATAALTVGSFGSDICLKAVSLTCNKAIDLVAYFATSTVATHPCFVDFGNHLKKKLLPQTLNTIKQVLLEFDEQKRKGYKFKHSVQLCLDDLKDVIDETNKVNDTVKELKQKYDASTIGYFYKVDCTPYMKANDINIKILRAMYNKLNTTVEIGINLDRMIAALPIPVPPSESAPAFESSIKVEGETNEGEQSIIKAEIYSANIEGNHFSIEGKPNILAQSITR